jgi:hypothetical protein
MVTASITLMPEITRAIGVSRALIVPFDLGRPFGAPGDPVVQHEILRALFDLCEREEAPITSAFAPAAHTDPDPSRLPN